MIVDSSAVVAVLAREPGHDQLLTALQASSDLRLSAATYLEAAIVVDRHPNRLLSHAFDELLETAPVDIVPVSERQAQIARAAYRDFGKGSGHPAHLNFGDCFSYALAIDRREPLLYTGDDFSHTDVRSALA